MSDILRSIIEGLQTRGFEATPDAIEWVKKALDISDYHRDSFDAKMLAMSLQEYGTKDQCIRFLDDYMNEDVELITGCKNGEEVFNLYLNVPHVELSHLFEIYNANDDTYFVCDVI